MTKSNKFGKYGIITKSNLFQKLTEFRLWLKNEKDLIDQTKEHLYYKEYIELFNNCNLPSKKYYDISKFQAKLKSRSLKENKAKEPYITDDVFVFDDERLMQKEKLLIKENEMNKKIQEMYLNLDKKKLDEMNERETKKKLMIQYYKTGQESTARELHNQYYNKTQSSKPVKESKFYNEDDNPEEFK
jgi:hypothetical protein